MESRERDNKGRFVKGNTVGRTFSGDGMATEMQARSVESRKRNLTLREAMIAEVRKQAAKGGDMTKLEYLVAKVIDNHARGKLTFKDMTYLMEILGEKQLTVKHEGDQRLVVTQQEADALDKWAAKDE